MVQRLALLEQLAEAYNRHDADAIMAAMAPECVFVSYFGPNPCGERFEGAEAVRARVVAGLEAAPDGRWRDPKHFIAGDRGVSEWTFIGTGPDGSVLEREGVDLFTFEGIHIKVKNTFQKWVQAS